MAKRQKPKRNGKKRGPKEVFLRITGDPATELAKLFKPKTPPRPKR